MFFGIIYMLLMASYMYSAYGKYSVLFKIMDAVIMHWYSWIINTLGVNIYILQNNAYFEGNYLQYRFRSEYLNSSGNYSFVGKYLDSSEWHTLLRIII